MPDMPGLSIQKLMETWLEGPQREGRKATHREYSAVSVPQRIGYSVRRSILCGSHEQRTQMLHSYFYVRPLLLRTCLLQWYMYTSQGLLPGLKCITQRLGRLFNVQRLHSQLSQ